MKSYREIADSVFARREQYIAEQRKKKQRITRATVSVGSVALVSLAGIALLRNDAFHDTPPVTDGGATTATVPTGAETTTDTTAPFATTDDDTTATTTVTDAPTQTAATTVTTRPSTSHTVKTEPTKTTATTTVSGKVVIIGEKPDDSGADGMVDGSNIFEFGGISPLLEQTMEQYADADVVYAVMVAVQPVVTEDYDELLDEFKRSDEMTKLAERKALAFEEWQAAVGTSDCDEKKAAYRSLESEYYIKISDFQKAYLDSLVNEQIDALAQLSEVELFDFYADMLTKPADEISPIVFKLSSMSYEVSNLYSAVLSADAIYELMDRGGYMFWLDSPNTVKDMYYLYDH